MSYYFPSSSQLFANDNMSWLNEEKLPTIPLMLEGQKMNVGPQVNWVNMQQNHLFSQSQLDAYGGESQVMAGLVVSVTNDNHQRGTNYPNDERCIPGYECYPSYDSKAQSMYPCLPQEAEFSMDTTSDYSSTQSAIDDTCASIADGSPITPRIPNKRSTSSSPSKRNKKSSTYSRWTSEEDSLLRQAVMLYGPHKWSMIASHVPNRTPMQCSTRWLGALNPNIYKGRWTQHEDAVLRYAVQEYSNIPDGEDGAQPIPWNKIAQRIPNRTGIQCQARWTEALDPTVRKGKWSEPEDALLRAGVQTYGKCWIRIAESIPGRTQRQCRTRWVQLKYKEEKQSTRTNSKASGKSSADASRGIQHSRQRSSVHSHIDDSVAPSLPQSSSSSTVSWEGESRTPFEDGSSDIVQVSNNNFFATDLKQYHQMVQPFSDVKFEVSRIYIPGFGLTTTDDWPR